MNYIEGKKKKMAKLKRRSQVAPKKRKGGHKKKQVRAQELDMRYLGERLPGTPLQRAKLLETLKDILAEEGEHWVELNREVLLKEAELLVDSGISFTAEPKRRQRKIR